MNFDQLHAEGCLKGLSLRATLQIAGEGSTPQWYGPQSRLVSAWVSTDEQPLLIGTWLRTVKLGGFDCCAVQAYAILPGEGSPLDEDNRAFVYLLNPADACVWQAIDSWVQHGSIASLANPRSGGSYSSVSPRDREVLKLRPLEGGKLDSDMLGCVIRLSLERGELEAELARQLDIKVPLYCAVVETPMMLRSLQAVDPEN